jgi:prepilin-type N-terminal cleavage/methylation domain-containing protein
MNTLKKLRSRGFTMAELLIVIVCVGLLATLAVPTVNRVRDALTDHAKARNADKLNEYMSALHNGGVDTSTYADGAAVITALRAGVSMPSTITGGAAMEVRLEKDVNSAAYTFTKGTSMAAPRFAAILDQRNVRP